MRSNDTTREPCPDRIIDDLGGSFGMGVVGGSIWYSLRGAYSHPRGERFAGAFQTARMNAARTGSYWAAWGGLYSVSDCAMVYLRQKEDPWNSILSGAFTGGVLSMRRGLRSSVGSAVAGAGFIAMIEGMVIMVERYQKMFKPEMVYVDADGRPIDMTGVPDFSGTVRSDQTVPEVQPESSAPEGSIFGRWFGKGKEESGRDSETKVLESYNIPTPMPTFEYK